MKSFDAIKKHEIRQTSHIAGALIEIEKSKFNWRIIKDAIKAKYTSKGRYLTFLNSLQKVEEEVIQAAITTMRKGTKKERRLWFDKVKATTRKIRLKAADRFYME